MRKPIMAGNWKMNKTISESLSFIESLKSSAAGISDIEILICPPFTSLFALREQMQGTQIALGAQNLFWEAKGAFTGEISPIMLKDSGCKYVLIGHSERRQYFGETDECVNKKTKAAFEAGLIPIVCVGETLKEREDNLTFKIIERQIRGGLSQLQPQYAKEIVIAYEPVWAIGTGKTASPKQAQEVHQFIRKTYESLYAGCAEGIRLLYGGSVKPDNISELMRQQDIDGGLVGGASLEPDSFLKLINYQK
ncbi:MAG: triose-phosphate isomerase [Elusimicrobiota bacterium]|nr:triose-phosphate isomerase [Elusimicrobiota bacterium]